MDNWYSYSGHKKYRYKVIAPIAFNLAPVNKNLAILDSKGRLLASLNQDGLLIIYNGYLWDGATCAPDFDKVMRATVIHDLMCQLSNHQYWPFTRQDGDFKFYEIAEQDNFNFSKIYFVSVFSFGMIKAILGQDIGDREILVKVC